MSHVALSSVAPGNSYAGGDFNGIFAGVRDITSAIRGGQLKGLIDMRDSELPDMQAQLDELSKSLIDQVNEVHNRGTSYPSIVNNLTGTRTFMSSSTQTVSFSGAEPTVMLYDTSGKEIASARVLDPATINFTNGGTVDDLANAMQTWIQAQDPQLVNASVSVNADGRMQIALGTDTIGIAFQDQESTIKGSAQKDVTASIDLDGDGTEDKSYSGFSNFLGLNDYFATAPNLSQWDSALKPANYALGIPTTATLQFSDSENPTGIAGGTVDVNPSDSLQTIADKINSNTALQGRIDAEVVPEGSGQRLRIRHLLGEQLTVTQAGGTNAIDTLGLDFSSNGYAQSMSVAQPLLDDSSRVSRGQIQLDPLTGKYLLAPGDSAIASQLSALFSGTASFDPAGSLSGTNLSFSDYAASIISRSATQASSTQSNLQVQQDLSDSLDQKQAQMSGVNLDEEMSQLMVFQQTYAASAKVISTTQQLFDVLNNLIQ
jgi:flagellar hook-associated protein 1 FlgK